MRMMVPPVKERRLIHKLLVSFFRDHKPRHFSRAITQICRFYRLKKPQVEWFEYLDWGRTAGRTYENGKIHLVHPENWKKGRKYNSERQWVNTVYHEMGHYVFWTDAERKADTFASRMEQSVNGNGASPARMAPLATDRKRASSRRAAA
jgi:predicted SprT family Zn-dependent metalloprotease